MTPVIAYLKPSSKFRLTLRELSSTAGGLCFFPRSPSAYHGSETNLGGLYVG